jgi:hypothetical protein
VLQPKVLVSDLDVSRAIKTWRGSKVELKKKEKLKILSSASMGKWKKPTKIYETEKNK